VLVYQSLKITMNGKILINCSQMDL